MIETTTVDLLVEHTRQVSLNRIRRVMYDGLDSLSTVDKQRIRCASVHYGLAIFLRNMSKGWAIHKATRMPNGEWVVIDLFKKEREARFGKPRAIK